jgi:hypothetical protein
MEREYFRRGQCKTVEEIDGVVAIRVTPNERGEASADVRSFDTKRGRLSSESGGWPYFQLRCKQQRSQSEPNTNALADVR